MTEAQAQWLRNRPVFMARWHVARALIHLGVRLAPPGPAKQILVQYLEAYGREVLAALAAHEQRKGEGGE